MRLLDKNELAKAKTIEKSREIAEGLKISKTVDKLRELRANEEQSLNKWREETLAAISQEISKAEDVKNTLLQEVSTLREEKGRGLKDVDDKLAWLKSFEESLNQHEESLAQKSLEVSNMISLANRNMEDSRRELEQARSHREEAEKLHRISLEDAKQAKLASMLAENTREQAELDRQKWEENLTNRAKVLEEREKSVKVAEKLNSDRESELRIEKIQLADQRRTLERAMSRIKKK